MAAKMHLLNFKGKYEFPPKQTLYIIFLKMFICLRLHPQHPNFEFISKFKKEKIVNEFSYR